MKAIFRSLVVSVLIWEAKRVLARYEPAVIAITGSVGKSSTKDALFTLLKEHLYVRKSQKSFNSEFGVPLTVLGLPSGWDNPARWLVNLLQGAWLAWGPQRAYPEWLILEIGGDAPGDVRKLCAWLSVDVTVLTRFPDIPVHVEFFESPEELIAEDRNLVRALVDDGLLVVNHDDERTRSEIVRTGQRRLSYGLSERADVNASDIEVSYDERGMPRGMNFTLSVGGRSVPVRVLGVLGEQPLYAVLAGSAVALELGVPLEQIPELLLLHEPPRGRMRLIAGVKGTLIIDDSYNSSPVALEKALETLHGLPVSGRRIAVLGDMLELGEYTRACHEEAGTHAARVVDLLLTVGVRSKDLARAARDAGMEAGKVIECADSHQAGATLKELIAEGDNILVKGSQSGIRTERVVKALMQDPARAPELLVRQEPEWLAKA